MDRRALIIFGLAVLILAAVLAYPKLQSNTSSAKKPYTVHEACDILTLEIAKNIIGSDAKVKSRDSSSGDIKVSNCTYFSVVNQYSVGLLARSARDKAGAASNQSQFASNKPVDSQKVVGYGDSAYWLARYGQLNILKGNTWYILSTGPVEVQKHTLTQTKKFADLIIDKL